MIFILFIMDISSIWGMIKDAVNVSRIFSHTELKQKFELRKSIDAIDQVIKSLING